MLLLLVHFLVSENTRVGVGDCLMNGEIQLSTKHRINSILL